MMDRCGFASSDWANVTGWAPQQKLNCIPCSSLVWNKGKQIKKPNYFSVSASSRKVCPKKMLKKYYVITKVLLVPRNPGIRDWHVNYNVLMPCVSILPLNYMLNYYWYQGESSVETMRLTQWLLTTTQEASFPFYKHLSIIIFKQKGPVSKDN